MSDVRFRIVPFSVGGEAKYTLVEEIWHGDVLSSDMRRQLDAAQFMRLREAILNVEGDTWFIEGKKQFIHRNHTDTQLSIAQTIEN